MYFVNCVCNPFLYSLLSQRFRLGFHILLTNAFNCNKIVVQSFMNFSNGYSRSPQHYQPGSQGVRRSLPNAIVVYQNGEATMSWTKMSKLSREPTVRTTDVWTKMWFSRINLLKKYVLTKKIYHHIYNLIDVIKYRNKIYISMFYYLSSNIFRYVFHKWTYFTFSSSLLVASTLS